MRRRSKSSSMARMLMRKLINFGPNKRRVQNKERLPNKERP
jgi:hypothetical protein